MEKGKLGGTHSREMLAHLKKQREVFMDLHETLSQELHKLQVEEEMLMRKFYDSMAAERSKKSQMGIRVKEKSQKEEHALKKASNAPCSESEQTKVQSHGSS